jgi:histidinol-phosphate/aromatic aminotransferase/cobyric acid decarboxylase-like protein
MSTGHSQDDLSFLLQRHAELEEKYGDGGGGRFLSGWQCENPWIEQIRALVDEQIRKIDSGQYLYLDSDAIVKEEVYRFHRSIDGAMPDNHFCGSGASSIIFTLCAWLCQQDIQEIYYIPPLYFSLHFALRLFGIRARAISGKHAFEPGFSFNLPSERSVLLFADPIWYAGIPLCDEIIKSLVEWQSRTGSLIFVDGSFQYAKWEGQRPELSASFDSEHTARLICPTKALASHGYRFAYCLLPKAMHASISHIYANIYGSASVDNLAFARIALTAMAAGTITSSLMNLSTVRISNSLLPDSVLIIPSYS